MILTRYIYREIYWNLLVITIILMTVLVMNEFSHYLKAVAAGKLTIGDAELFTALQLIAMLTYLLPLGLFLSILLGLGRMYIDNEMTVISACGVSFLKQTLIVLSFAGLVALFSAWLSLWLNPLVNYEMEHIKVRLINNFQIGTLVPKRFETFGKHVVYATKVSHGNNTIKGVFLAEKHALNRWDIVVAQEATQQSMPDTDGKFIVVKNGIRYTGIPGTPDFTVSKFTSYGVNTQSDFLLGKHTAVTNRAYNKSIGSVSSTDLWHADSHDRYAMAELQLRLAIPLSVLIASLIAVALSKVNPRYGRFSALIPAIILYLVYANLIFLSRSWMQRGTIPASLGMWWVHGLMLVVLVFLFLYRVGWRRLCKF